MKYFSRHEPSRNTSEYSTATVPELTCEALQATASEGLAQGPYVAARVGFEPVTIRSEGTEPYH